MKQQDVALSKNRSMDAAFFAVAEIEIILAEHLEHIRFGIWNKGKDLHSMTER